MKFFLAIIAFLALSKVATATYYDIYDQADYYARQIISYVDDDYTYDDLWDLAYDLLNPLDYDDSEIDAYLDDEDTYDGDDLFYLVKNYLYNLYLLDDCEDYLWEFDYEDTTEDVLKSLGSHSEITSDEIRELYQDEEKLTDDDFFKDEQRLARLLLEIAEIVLCIATLGVVCP